MPPAPRNPFDVLSVMSINPSLDLAKMKFELSAIEANPFPCRRPSTIEPTYNLRLNDVPLSDDAWEFSPFSGEWNCERTSFLICRNSIFCDLLCLKSSHHTIHHPLQMSCSYISIFRVGVYRRQSVEEGILIGISVINGNRGRAVRLWYRIPNTYRVICPP